MSRGARWLAVCALGLAACASPPEVYEPTESYYVDQEIVFPDAGAQIERGEPIWIFDAFNDYLISLPTKILLWNRHVLDHRMSETDQRILEAYLAMNRLHSVKVRHNEYAPIDEFRRLTQNTEVGAGYRYTLGLFNWLMYTLVPDRIFAGVPIIGGGDHFNPFTNTINVYSSDVTVLLHEAGHAKDYVEHEWKGTSFALLRLLPGIDLMQEANASSDAIRFLYCIHDEPDEVRAYHTLIPAYSTYIAGYFQGGLIVTVPIVIAGHISGRVQGAEREDAHEHEKDSPKSDMRPPFCVPLEDVSLDK
jgi:hypothetical protein